MLVKLFNVLVIVLGLMILQGCQGEEEEENYGYVFVAHGTNQAITVSTEMQLGGSVYFSSNSETPHQVWKAIEIDWNSYQLQNTATGKCIALSSDNMSPEIAEIELTDCEKTASQYWSISKTSSGAYSISLKGSNSYFGVIPGCPVSDYASAHQRFSVGLEDGCNRLAVVSSYDALNFELVEVDVDVDPGGDDGTPDDNDPGGDDGTQDDNDPGGDDGTPDDDDPGGDDGTQDDNDPGGDDGTPDDNDPGGDDGTGDPGDQSDQCG